LLPEPILALHDGVMALVHAGGHHVVWIFLSGVLLWTLVVERWWYFSRVLPRRAAALRAHWEARRDRTSWVARQVRNATISRLRAEMTAPLPIMNVCVPMAPLLGLVGTVSGMLEVFDSMALRGAADAGTMASGVSQAMVCTLTGLAVSITGLYPVFYFRGRVLREASHFAEELTH